MKTYKVIPLNLIFLYALLGFLTLIGVFVGYQGFMRPEAGGDFIIMPPYVLPPTGSWLPSEVLSPPPVLISGRPLRYLRHPKAESRGDPPLRPERHSPHAIATIKRKAHDHSVKPSASVPRLSSD